MHRKFSGGMYSWWLIEEKGAGCPEMEWKHFLYFCVLTQMLFYYTYISLLLYKNLKKK